MLSYVRKVLGLDKNQDPYYNDSYDVKSIGNIVIPEKLTDLNAFTLANSVPELFFPIDFYADRISKLRFYIANKAGEEDEKTELNRYVKAINPLYSFSDLVYQYIFSLFATGNTSNYTQVPTSFGTKSVNSITRWDVLHPDYLKLQEYYNMSTLDMLNLTDAIKKAEYFEGQKTKQLDLNLLTIHNYSQKKRSDSIILSKSPQFTANKSIDTLLAVYSARYNVYANNGAAGYLAKKTTVSSGNLALETVMSDSNKRDEIIKDINDRNGLTGKRNLWGISGTPIEFVKTIATISELMPLEETLESSIKIASVYQIPPVLVPRKDQSTYDNQSNAEKNVWENSILAMVETVCQNLTKLFMLDTVGYSIKADISSVSCLVQNESSNEDLNLKKLNNLEKIKQLNPNANIETEVTKILDSYGN